MHEKQGMGLQKGGPCGRHKGVPLSHPQRGLPQPTGQRRRAHEVCHTPEDLDCRAARIAFARATGSVGRLSSFFPLASFPGTTDRGRFCHRAPRAARHPQRCVCVFLFELRNVTVAQTKTSRCNKNLSFSQQPQQRVCRDLEVYRYTSLP